MWAIAHRIVDGDPQEGRGCLQLGCHREENSEFYEGVLFQYLAGSWKPRLRERSNVCSRRLLLPRFVTIQDFFVDAKGVPCGHFPRIVLQNPFPAALPKHLCVCVI